MRKTEGTSRWSRNCRYIDRRERCNRAQRDVRTNGRTNGEERKERPVHEEAAKGIVKKGQRDRLGRSR